MVVREATGQDVPAMERLAHERRQRYEQYQPRFWHSAPNAARHHQTYLEDLMKSPRHFLLVAEHGGEVEGFLVAALVASPPVYDPGGLTCSIDDFWVRGGVDWSRVGQELLAQAMRTARSRGACQVVVVAAKDDQAKRSFLAAAGYEVASEWHVKPL